MAALPGSMRSARSKSAAAWSNWPASRSWAALSSRVIVAWFSRCAGCEIPVALRPPVALAESTAPEVQSSNADHKPRVLKGIFHHIDDRRFDSMMFPPMLIGLLVLLPMYPLGMPASFMVHFPMGLMMFPFPFVAALFGLMEMLVGESARTWTEALAMRLKATAAKALDRCMLVSEDG